MKWQSFLLHLYIKLTQMGVLTLALWFIIIIIICWQLMMQSLGWFTNSKSFVKAKLHLIRRWHALTQYHDTIFAALCSQEFFFQICLVSRFRKNQGTTAAQKTTNVVIMQCNRWECNLRGKRLGKNPTLISKSPSKRASSLKKEGMCALAQRRFDLLAAVIRAPESYV